MKPLHALALVPVAAAALVAAGYAAGRLTAPSEVIAAPLGETYRALRAEASPADAKALADALAAVEALRAERDGLQGQIAALGPRDAAPGQPEQSPPRKTRREAMEEIRRADPERYERIQTRQREFRERMAEALTQRDAFLGSINPDFLTPEQQETHRRFTEALAAQQEALARIQELEANGGEVSEADRRAVGEAFRAVRELEDAERDALLGAVATSMGLRAGEEADSFVEVVRSIYDSTGTMPAVRMGPPPPGP